MKGVKGEEENNFLGFKDPLWNTRLFCWGNISNISSHSVSASGAGVHLSADERLQHLSSLESFSQLQFTQDLVDGCQQHL